MERKIEKLLLDWKNSKKRMPLIVNGARQVGKTYILKDFGNKNYDKVLHVNLESNFRAREAFESDLIPKNIIERLEAIYGERIEKGRSLLILDEIQSSERALTSLKYFCEDAPEYHVAAAGSLLGVAINREKFSFPVGKVDELNLYPLDFEEFLWAMGKLQLSQIIKQHYESNEPLDEALHNEAISLLKKYYIIGGMPGVVKKYIENESLLEVVDIQNRILNEYVSDMSKYATGSTAVKIRACYNSIPAQLAKENRKFQYKVVQRGGTASIFGESIEWLKNTGVVLNCQLISQGNIPIPVYVDLSDFKLYMSDTGLLTMKSNMPHSMILSNVSTDIKFLGSITENFVAQTLTANGFSLYYWKSDSKAEVDFVVQKDEYVIPIEVKAGTHVKSKSLGVFNEKFQIQKSIRTSMRNFGLDNGIKSVPLYALFCLKPH